ncbi:hypothetical protein [Mycoplasmopsis gallinacea]|uniref:Core-binding (CB) domain-containing protein n=1 Tax=Mycoplasmopsis gallinacea TaxID=29556 RepID=A0A449A2F9_9BACT|nr:hypothetical protein [Mycoplasmopsis gallinacea]VEU58418.1 Uncharacterised protein [Mycoplasmopsis gallinacea]
MRHSLEQLKQEYLNTIKNPGTQQSYKSILNKIDTLDIQKLSTLLIQIKKERKNNYAALSYRVVKQFLRFVEDLEKTNLQVSKLTNIKVEKEIKTALTDHQMNLIYDIAKNSRDQKFCFFLAFMRENVCRISEAIKVINDVDKWETKNGETTQINQANKNGNYRVFRIPSEWEDKWKTFVPFVKETIQKQLTRFSSYLKREWAQELDGVSLKSHDYRTAGGYCSFYKWDKFRRHCTSNRSQKSRGAS